MSILDVFSKFHMHIADRKKVSADLNDLATWLQEIKSGVDQNPRLQKTRNALQQELDTKLSESVKDKIVKYIAESFILAEDGYQDIERIKKDIEATLNKIFLPRNQEKNIEICNDLEKLIQDVYNFKKRLNLLTALTEWIKRTDLPASGKPWTFKRPLIIVCAGMIIIPGACYAFYKSSLNYGETNCMDTPFYKISSVAMANKKLLGISCLKAYSENPKDNVAKLKLKQAKLEFEELVEADNTDKEATFFLEASANLLAQSNGSKNRPKYPESIKLFDKYLDREISGNPSIPDEIVDIIVRLGHFLGSEKQYPQARKYYKAALGKDKKNINALLGVCTTHFDINDQSELQKMLEECSNAIKYLEPKKNTDKDPVLALAYNNKGCVEARLGEYSKSSESFKRGKKKNDADSHLNRAYFNSLVLNDKHEEAIEFYRDRDKSTLERNDADDSYVFAFGIMRFAMASDMNQPSGERKKNYKEAFDAFKELNQTNKIHRDYLGRTKLCLDDMKSCKTNWSIKSEPNHELVDNMHKVFLAFITTYEMNPVVRNAPIVFQSRNDRELKGQFCELRKKPENELGKPPEPK
jgi:tetratricopeptide (TPR) repeat protein